ncbi:MAG: hypothetical protein KY461_11975 [Actinobacteria bacterium]|nr:hypothetical protein [Actinomycetota bacterium]
MFPTRWRASAAFLTVAALTAAAGCSAPTDTATEDTPTADERIATVRALRAAVGADAAALGTAAATVALELDRLHASLPAGPAERRAAVAAAEDATLDPLRDALEGFGPDLAGDATGPDAEAVRGALGDAASAAAALASEAERDLATVTRTAAADERLLHLVAAWSEPGSRSEQLRRLEEVAAAAEALAAELEDVEETPACLGSVPRRAEAAVTVARGSRELASLVEARRGEEFDVRRRELSADPFGTGGPLVVEDRARVACWREQSAVVDRADAVASALDELEAALNPTDLGAGAGG